VKATDGVGAFGTKALSIAIAASPVVITTAALPGGTAGTAYNSSVAATGGTGGITFSIDSGSLPAGLSLAASGAITGNPTTAGTANFTVKATDSAGASATRALSISVVAASSPLTIATVRVFNVPVGFQYDFTLAATGGTPGYSWGLASGQLPAGLTLSANGVISGIPTRTSGSAVGFRVRVTDSTGATATRDFSMRVTFVLFDDRHVDGTVSVSYARNLVLMSEDPFQGAVIAGTLPPGLILRIGTYPAVPYISGTPTTPGSFPFTIRFTDRFGFWTTRDFRITILPAGVQLRVQPQVQFGSVGNRRQWAPAVAFTPPSQGPLTWTSLSGALPPGVTMTSPGVFAGTPTAAGLYTVHYLVTNGIGWSATASLYFIITP
jgi:hypothetical protein